MYCSFGIFIHDRAPNYLSFVSNLNFLCFPLKVLKFFLVTHEFLIHPELIFLYSISRNPPLFFLLMNTQFSQCHLFSNYFPPSDVQ